MTESGGNRLPFGCPRCRQMADKCTCPPAPESNPAQLAQPDLPSRSSVVRVGRETKGRRGKGVTVVSDLPLDEARLQQLATHLKQRLGTGGTAKDGRIEIQGDQRDRVGQELERLGYRVKRAGG